MGFLGEGRLGYQLDRARCQGRTFAVADEALVRLNEWFNSYFPKPVLLHGDLWSGNIGFAGEGEPVMFGLAVYYGDREPELGIIEMFGGSYALQLRASIACLLAG
ncbi:MAG: hypothetical protein M2R45_00305 [Verrucomicrobia subdivision 3 bacterium]|nr:hypothetical protein [Limisphaerales bacterium]MCS1412936.1 hypothetical protein [Limisphaerales bacterium]